LSVATPTVPCMTSSPNSPDRAWVLEATIRTAPVAAPQWQAQLDRLRQIASYDPETQTWHARLGALDLAGMQMLQTLFDAARVHGTEVRLTARGGPGVLGRPQLHQVAGRGRCAGGSS
jgi:hypothetical protein